MQGAIRVCLTSAAKIKVKSESPKQDNDLSSVGEWLLLFAMCCMLLFYVFCAEENG
jgi:hypothetical protein